jgi:hypothetical protein
MQLISFQRININKIKIKFKLKNFLLKIIYSLYNKIFCIKLYLLFLNKFYNLFLLYLKEKFSKKRIFYLKFSIQKLKILLYFLKSKNIAIIS